MQTEQATTSKPTTATTSHPAEQRNLTAWVSGVLLVVMLFAAGWVIVGSLSGSSADSKDLTPVMPPGMRLRNLFGQQAPQAPQVPRDGVRVRPNDSYLVRSGAYTLNANKSAKDGTWSLRFTTDRNDILTAEQDAAFTARWRFTHDSAYAKSLGVTPEQIAKLGEIPGKGGLIIGQAERDRLQHLIEAHAAAPAPKEKEQAALVAALAEIGEGSIEPTRKDLLDRVEKVRAILTPEQLAKFK